MSKALAFYIIRIFFVAFENSVPYCCETSCYINCSARKKYICFHCVVASRLIYLDIECLPSRDIQ